MITALLQAMRPYQWVKNLLVFAALVFSENKIGDVTSWNHATLAFLIFCCLSSAVYLLNDVVDRKADQAHPRKRHRPIASGRLPVVTAVGVSVVLGTASLVAAAFLSERVQSPMHPMPFIVWPATYYLMNLAYSFSLKGLLIIDCLIIALGFLFRVHAGSVAIGVESSSWILLCTFFFALFLAFCKRRDEIAKDDGTGATRATLRQYSQAYLDQIIPPLAALSILCYALYTLADRTVETHKSTNLIITLPIVVFGVFRYLFLVHHRGEGGDPSRILFRDPPLIGSGFLYLVAVYVALTAPPLFGQPT